MFFLTTAIKLEIFEKKILKPKELVEPTLYPGRKNAVGLVVDTENKILNVNGKCSVWSCLLDVPALFIIKQTAFFGAMLKILAISEMDYSKMFQK